MTPQRRHGLECDAGGSYNLAVCRAGSCRDRQIPHPLEILGRLKIVGISAARSQQFLQFTKSVMPVGAAEMGHEETSPLGAIFRGKTATAS
jgi:hypothetical protein